MQLAVLGGSSLLGGGFLGKAAMFGASVGMSLLFKGKQKPQGKLNDLRVSSASYGRGIPNIWGTIRVTGNIFWSTDFREKKVYVTSKGKTKSGGKGEKKAKKGKAQVVYKYWANFAVGLAEGTIDDVLRIWADNNLIYDKLNPDNEDIVGVGFSRRDEQGGGKQAAKSPGGKKGRRGESGRFAWRFYPGTEYQMPDPYMEKVTKAAAQKEKFGDGKLSSPAYRDLAYLVFQDFALEDFGNRIPTITAEITKKAERRPSVSQFDILDPPPHGWIRSIDTNINLDYGRDKIVAPAMYAGADGKGYWAMRIFDITTRREERRIMFGPEYPYEEQTVVWPQKSGVEILGPYITVTRQQIMKWVPIGMTHKGDIVMRTNFGNAASTIAFMDGTSGKCIKLWGTNTHAFDPPLSSGIFAAGSAYPFPYSYIFSILTANEDTMVPHVGTAVRSMLALNDWIFDDNYDLVGWTTSKGPRRGAITPGAPQTTNARMAITTNFGGVDQFLIYKGTVDMPIVLEDFDVPSGGLNPEILLTTWPEVPFGIGPAGYLYMGHFGYVVGAEALGMIAGTNGTQYAVKIDPIDGDVLWQYPLKDPQTGLALATPNNTMFATPAYSNTNVVSWARASRHVRVDFRSETVEAYAFSEGFLPNYWRGDYYWSEKDAYIYITQRPEDGAATFVICYLDRKIQTGASLAEICTDVAEMCGIPQSRIDTSELVQTDEVIGYMYEQPMEARGVIEELSELFMFDVVESDDKLKFRSRGNDTIITIPQKDLGIVQADFGGENEFYSETRQNENELPKRGTITYFNPKEDYEQATQIFSRPSDPIPVMNTNDALEVTANMALEANVARSLISRVVYAAWTERTSRMVTLPRDYLHLDPTDVITVALENGETFEGRLTDITIGSNFEMQVAMVSQVSDSYKHVIESDSTRGPILQPPKGPGAASPAILNIPYLDDSDVEDGAEFTYYWGAMARDPGFAYGVLQAQYADTQMRVEGGTNRDVLWGYVSGMVPAPTLWNGIDEEASIELIPGFNFNANEVVYEWESIPDNEWPNTNNMIVIGDEIILFKNVEELPNGNVKISTLVRGFRGTISAAEKHTNNPKSDKWVLVIGNEVRTSRDNFDLMNQEQIYNIHTGNPYAAVTMKTKDKLDAATRRPLPVGDVRRTQVSGNVKIDWSRSTRYNGALKDGTATIPLNEESERYNVYLLKAPYNAAKWNPSDTTLFHVVREDLTTPTTTFTAAQLGTYGLTATSDLHVVITQNSTVAGLGFPHGLTLSYSMFGV